MPTPKYDSLKTKVRDWSNKPETSTIPDSVVEDCLGYSADECYRVLRIPPLESSVKYTVEAADNIGDGGSNSPYNASYTSFSMPSDLIQFVYIRTLDANGNQNSNRVFNEITDRRSFFDIFAERYSAYNWMWTEGKMFIRPQLAVGTVIEIGYYRRLPDLNAQYDVTTTNYVIGTSDASQPYFDVGTVADTALYTATSGAIEQCFSTYADAFAYNPTVTTHYFTGKEVANWLRDENERLLIWGALYSIGAYLLDDGMEKRYQARFNEIINSLNKEEKMRRASGGNIQVGFNANGMI